MYFITTKRMLEVCFSAHPNIQYRTLKYFFPEGVSSPGWCVFSFTSFLRLRGRVDSCPCFSLNQDVFHPITSAFLKIPPAKSPLWTKTAGLSNWERP